MAVFNFISQRSGSPHYIFGVEPWRAAGGREMKLKMAITFSDSSPALRRYSLLTQENGFKQALGCTDDLTCAGIRLQPRDQFAHLLHNLRHDNLTIA